MAKNMDKVVYDKDFKWRIVKKYGELMMQGGDKNSERWSNWFFRISNEPKKHWIYYPEFNVWRCNISSF